MKRKALVLALCMLLVASFNLSVFADATGPVASTEKIVLANSDKNVLEEQTVAIRVMKGFGETSLDVRYVPVGSLFTLPEFSGKTIDGHTFRGWDYNSNNSPDPSTKFGLVGDSILVNYDVTLLASWEKRVTFDAQGGSPVASQMKVINKAFGQLPEVSKLGFTFEGWYTENGQLVTKDSWVNPLPAKETLYAHYKPIVTEKTWALNTHYKVGDKVSYAGKTWTCTFTHTAYAPNWYPGAPGIWFWK